MSAFANLDRDANRLDAHLLEEAPLTPSRVREIITRMRAASKHGRLLENIVYDRGVEDLDAEQRSVLRDGHRPNLSVIPGGRS